MKRSAVRIREQLESPDDNPDRWLKSVSPDSHLMWLCTSFRADLNKHVAAAQRHELRGEEIPLWTTPATEARWAEICRTQAAGPGGRKAKIGALRAYLEVFVPPADMTPDRLLAASLCNDVLLSD